MVHRKKRCRLNTHDIIKTKQELSCLKHALAPIYEEMGVPRNKFNSLNIRFGRDAEFGGKDTDGFVNKRTKEIVIKKNRSVAQHIGTISHEVGHIVTKTGFLGTKNIIAETTAYNFQNRAIKKFNKKTGSNIHYVNEGFIKELKKTPIHTFSLLLSDIPISHLLRQNIRRKTTRKQTRKSTSRR